MGNRRTHFRAFSAYVTPSVCCVSELDAVRACRYDLARLGCRIVDDPQASDLLVIPGGVTETLAPHLRRLYDQMVQPRWVMALGACAISGGVFSNAGVQSVVPVDVYVPGCPPRPEAILNGLITLQEVCLEDRGTPRVVSAAP